MNQETCADPLEFGYLQSAAQLFNSGQFSAAAAAYSRALGVSPERVSSWNNLGRALYQSGRLDESIDALRTALALAPESAQVCNDLAVAVKDVGRTAEALTLFDRAINLRQRRSGAQLALINKAVLLLEMGDFTGARCAADEALSLDPEAVMAWHLRVSLKHIAPGDPDLEALESLLERAGALRMTEANRIRLHFALAKAWLDAGDAQRAFERLEQGNRLKRATYAYDSDATTRQMAAIAAQFTPELLQRFSGRGGHPSDVPVFVVGMPRSGTSLIEQILASHPSVHGAGELALLGNIVPGATDAGAYHCPPSYPQRLAQMDADDLTRLGAEYEAQLRKLCADKARVVDKMPANFLFAGFIHLILPNARIIHCRRDPLDTCLSCYAATFNGEVMFAYDQRELGSYYRHYERLASHWRSILPPDRYREVHYEAVVECLEHEARQLVEFCALPWDERCLSFHETRRPVRTASALAVRKPIYRNSIGRSRDYARYLGPLMDALAS